MLQEESVRVYISIAVTDLGMSDSKISFLNLFYESTSQVIYNYKTNALTVRYLPLIGNVGYIDTYNDYWLYTTSRNTLAILEYPNGDLQMFNISSASTVKSNISLTLT